MSYCDIDNTYMEMHLLAYTYHWDINSFWNLTLSQRRKWVSIVVKQKEAERESLENHK